MFKMAFRNIFRQKRRSLLTALTMLGGYILGAMSIGLIDGTYNDVVDTFTRSRLGHIQIQAAGYRARPTLNKVIRDQLEIGRIIDQEPWAEAWAPRVYSAGLASVGDRTDAARIIGIDPARETRATRFDKKITEGRSFSPSASKEIVLGKGLAQNLKASLGDTVVLVSQGADGSLANDSYRLIGLADTGDMSNDRTTMYLQIDDARELLVLDGSSHEIVVIARSLDGVLPLNSALRNRLTSASVDVRPWQEFAKSFYNAMQADTKGHQVMLLILFIVVAIGVLNTALMSVLERRREYGVLKALGTRPKQVFSLVILEILILAVMSIILGAGLSLGINSYFAQHHVIVFSKSFTYGGMNFDSFSAEVNLRSFVIPALIVLLSAFFVSLMPAIKAARTEPARSIRIF